MDQHLSRSDLMRALAAGSDQTEVDSGSLHLLRCGQCLDLAAELVEELREDLEKRQALLFLQARGWWAELGNLSPAQQRDRIRSVAALRTRELFEVAIADAAAAASSDPHLGEETALTARMLAELLPCAQYPEALKCDLEGEALIVIANSRRLAADWSGSRAALQEARRCFEKGTGDPKLAARLFSVSASLASDTGNFEAAHRLLAQAEEKCRLTQDRVGLATVAVQKAGNLLAEFQIGAAIRNAEQALTLLSPGDDRLEMLARSVVTECLIDLQRPDEAFRSFLTTRPLFDRFPGRETEIKRVAYLEARLLEALGYVRESEKAFRELIKSDLEEGFYKDAFIHTLTFFESLYRRGALEKAARVCEEAASLLDTPLCHAQMKQVWEQLLAQVRSDALTAGRILEVRLYILRHWSVPAARLPQYPETAVTAITAGFLAVAELDAGSRQPAAEAQPVQRSPEASSDLELPELAHGGYEKALDDYDRKLIAAALEQTGGNIEKTLRLVGMSRNGLMTKIERLGLTSLVARLRRPKAKSLGPRRKARYGPAARS
ncbi:MAG TPA: helix-turn-helix domain-containing protein [Thermoanaerobaculia bacterium]|nr:helix-turn-helix domain-containing protein [Thermoanaerobaculia bacterium]